MLSDATHDVTLNGVFAQAVRMLSSTGEVSPLLHHIEKQHVWLSGLPRAVGLKKTDAKVLLGQGLGMLFVEVTSKCNERCIHCYADSSPERNEFLSFAQIRSVLKEAVQMGQPFVQFTGGDPLIHPDIVKLTAEARQLGVAGIEIYTNGLSLHQPLLDQLAPFSPRFCFSVYSCNASVHDSITRVSGSLKRTLAAIQNVQSLGLEVRIGIALMQENESTLADTLTYLQQELAIPEHFIRIDPINAAGRGVDVAAAEHTVIEHKAAPHTPDTNQAKSQRLGKLSIAANGDVSPCIFSRDIVLGNINHSSLSDMIHGLDQLPAPTPSIERWQACKKRLSCHDCRMIAYHLGA